MAETVEKQSATEASSEPKQSPRFNASDADVHLISKDNVVFCVHRLNLIAGSSVFGDMFTVGKSEVGADKPTRIEVDDTAEVLEQILPYLYPEPVEMMTLDTAASSKMWDVIKALDKYRIGRGMEALGWRFHRHVISGSPRASTTMLVSAYVVANHFGLQDLRKAATRELVERDVSSREVERTVRQYTHVFPSADVSPLTAFISLRYEELMRWRHRYPGEYHFGTLADPDKVRILQDWAKTHRCTTAKSLDAMKGQLNEHPCARTVWLELGDYLRSLPVDF